MERPHLAAGQPRFQLPDLDIVVVHRADGSGTSYAWTDYLSKTSPEWKARVGSGLAPKWPVGRAASGNDGVAKLVKELGGSIGYVEFIYALQNHLSFGKVRNQNGEFVGASLESIAVAVDHAAPMDDDFKVSIVNAPGAGATRLRRLRGWWFPRTSPTRQTQRHVGLSQMDAGAGTSAGRRARISGPPEGSGHPRRSGHRKNSFLSRDRTRALASQGALALVH